MKSPQCQRKRTTCGNNLLRVCESATIRYDGVLLYFTVRTNEHIRFNNGFIYEITPKPPLNVW